VLWEIFYTKTLYKLKDLLIFFEVGFKDIILEESKFLEAIWENHETYAILYALEPVTAIDVPVDPEHFSIALPEVIFVLSLVDVAALPVEFSIAVFHISAVLTLKLIANSFDRCGCRSRIWVSFLTPFSFTVFHSVKELSCIGIAV
jgi:hypothetical protein